MLNRVVLIGRLTKDPDLRYTPAGHAVCRFTLAVDRAFSQEDEADFIPIVAWRKTAEACANYLRKGRLTAVDGRIQVRSYENEEGRRIYVTEVVADNVRFLESPGRGDQIGSRADAAGRDLDVFDDFDSDPFMDDGKPIDISDDDLPF